MSYFDELEAEPWRFDFFDVMRRIERSLGQPLGAQTSAERSAAFPARGPRPRIGDSGSRRDELIPLRGRALRFSFGQHPWMEFPASNIHELEWRPVKPPEAIRSGLEAEFDFDDPQAAPDRVHLVVKFLGLLGAQGALPLASTEETYGWMQERDSAFAHFLDIFNNRFLQLFYRAWADARPIVQHDRADCDRFRDYVNSVIGVGSPAFAGLARLPNGISLYAGLLGPQVKSASRLRSAIRGLFDAGVEIDQFVGSWLNFEPAERTRLGSANSQLGESLLLGQASFSVQDKIRVRLFVKDMATFRHFLPEGQDCQPLIDLVFCYIGEEIDWDLELALPARHVMPIRLGEAGELGWTSWMAPDYPFDSTRCDARFNPAERARLKAERAVETKGAGLNDRH